MRKFRMLALIAVIVMIAAACQAEEGGDGDGDGGTEQSENKGTVNVLSALSAEEGEALQAIIDDMITPEVDYTVEIEASEQFEEQFQIRADSGTLDLILLPQPGAIPDKVAAGSAVSLEDMGFDMGELGSTFGEYYLSLGEVDGAHPLARGYGARADAYFVNSAAFEVTDPSKARVVARYAGKDEVLRSGWLLGADKLAGRAALVEATLGRGRVVLFGFRPQHRGQTWGTFPFIFNAVESGSRQ